MAYGFQFGVGHRAWVANVGEQTVVAIANEQPGQQQQSSTSFTTGPWTAPLQAFQLGNTAVIQIFAQRGDRTIHLQSTNIRPVASMDLSMAQPMSLDSVDLPAHLTPMQPNAPMPSMTPMPSMSPMPSSMPSSMPSMSPMPSMTPMPPLAPMTPPPQHSAPTPPPVPSEPKPGQMRLGNMMMDANAMTMQMGDMTLQMGNQSPPPAQSQPRPQPQQSVRRFCSQCGAAVEPSDRFCASCGHALTPPAG